MARATALLCFAMLLPPAHALASKKPEAPASASPAPVSLPAGAHPSTTSFEIAEQLPAGLESWLREFVEALARRDLAAVLRYFDPENRAEQASIGVRCDAQYVIEGLGVNQSGLISGPEFRRPVDYPTLFSTVEHISLSGVDFLRDAHGTPIENYTSITGEVRFEYGGRYRIALNLQRQADGRWLISPAVG